MTTDEIGKELEELKERQRAEEARCGEMQAEIAALRKRVLQLEVDYYKDREEGGKEASYS